MKYCLIIDLYTPPFLCSMVTDRNTSPFKPSPWLQMAQHTLVRRGNSRWPYCRPFGQDISSHAIQLAIGACMAAYLGFVHNNIDIYSNTQVVGKF